MEELKYRLERLEINQEETELEINRLSNFGNVPQENYDKIFDLSLKRRELLYSVKILKELETTLK